MSYITDRHFTLSLTPGLAAGTTCSKPIEISWVAFFRNFMSAVKMLCSSLPSGRGIVFARDTLVLAWAACVVRSGRGGESLGRPLSTEDQIPGVMPIIIPSIFRGTWRMLLRVQKETTLKLRVSNRPDPRAENRPRTHRPPPPARSGAGVRGYGRRLHVLGSDADADEPSGEAAQDGESGEEPER